MGERIQLPATLDLMAATPLKAMIASYRGQALDLDGSAVERFGGQCLQVLLAAQAQWTADGAAFAIHAPSDKFREHLRLLGAAGFFTVTESGGELQ